MWSLFSSNKLFRGVAATRTISSSRSSNSIGRVVSTPSCSLLLQQQQQQKQRPSHSLYYSSTSRVDDRIVVAVGGNALQRRGEDLSVENMLKAAEDMAPTIAKLKSEHEIVLVHGNGPQVGALALERKTATFDVLGAESMGQIGYVLSQALSSSDLKPVPIITQTVVDPQHEAFQNPTKFVGKVYDEKEAKDLASKLGWTVKQDGDYYRRVVPSPPPKEILQVHAIRTLLESSESSSENGDNVLPIACGGGGVPVSRDNGKLVGVEAVIDKDMCGSKLAVDLEADAFIILTDGGGIWENFGKPNAREMKAVTPEYLLSTKAGKEFPGSMGPKIQAAIDFVQNSTSGDVWAAIGDLKDADKIVSNMEGTIVKNDVDGDGVIWR